MIKIKEACKVEDCGNWARVHGLCDKHLKRWQRHGHTNPTRPKDWGSREKHPLYQIWAWRRRKKNNALCKEWRSDFWKFASDVGLPPGENFKLQRTYKDVPYGPHNFVWEEKRVKMRDTESDREYANRYQRVYRKSESGKRSFRNSSLKKTFGITLDDYESMLDGQNSVCAICGKPESTIHSVTKQVQNMAVDHCHETGKIRGLLCSKCNTGLGSFKDSKKLLQAAINYLNIRR